MDDKVTLIVTITSTVVGIIALIMQAKHKLAIVLSLVISILLITFISIKFIYPPNNNSHDNGDNNTPSIAILPSKEANNEIHYSNNELVEKDISVLSDLYKPECKDKNLFLEQIKDILKNKTFTENDVVKIVSNIKNSLRYDNFNDKFINTNRNVLVGFSEEEYNEQYIGEFKRLDNGEFVLNGYGIYVDNDDYIYIGEWSDGKKNGINIEYSDHDVTKGIYLNNNKLKDITGFYIPYELRILLIVFSASFFISTIISIIINVTRKRKKAIS